MVFYIVETQSRNDSRGVAGKRPSCGVDEHELPAPSAHAGLGIAGIVVGNDGVDANLSRGTLLRFGNDQQSLIDLLACGHERGAVPQRPPVVLNVSNLHTVWLQSFEEADGFVEVIEILPMNDQIDRERRALLLNDSRKFDFPRMGLSSGDPVSAFFLGILEAKLNMVKTGTDELL